MAPGVFVAKALNIDPSAELMSGTTGRASVLAVVDLLFIDSRTNSPMADPRAGLFALSFDIIAIDADGLANLTVGLPDPSADEISAVGGRSIVPDPDSISISIVPEPTTGVLVLIGLALLGRSRRIPLR